MYLAYTDMVLFWFHHFFSGIMYPYSLGFFSLTPSQNWYSHCNKVILKDTDKLTLRTPQQHKREPEPCSQMLRCYLVLHQVTEETPRVVSRIDQYPAVCIIGVMYCIHPEMSLRSLAGEFCRHSRLLTGYSVNIKPIVRGPTSWR